VTYLLPPLNALRAFEAAARHLSFKLAAQELHVTAGAVAQQVKGLEARLGLRLFERLHRQLILTPAGQGYLAPLCRAFRTIADATQALHPAGAVVNLGLPADFDLRRIERLSAGTPGLQLRLSQPAGLHELAEGKIDALIARGVDHHPGYRCCPLADGEMLLSAEGIADCPEIVALRAITPRRSPRSPAAKVRPPSRRSSSSRPARLRPARAAE
jgi:LysR family transcriptional regulator, glycine cleavage system transcriptional activator